MRLATSSCCSCNPGCQERRSITHALLPTAVAMRFLTGGCKPPKQERHTKSTNVRAALTMETIPRYSGHASFLPVLYAIDLSLQSRAHFSGLIFQKCSDASPVHFLSATFPDRAANPRKPLGQPQEPHYPKKTGFAPESLLTRELTRFRTVTLPNCLMMSG